MRLTTKNACALLCLGISTTSMAVADVVTDGATYVGGDMIIVADGADGFLEVNGSEMLETGELYLATVPSATGTVLIRNPGTRVILAGNANRLDVQQGTGFIEVSDGAVVDGSPTGCPPDSCNFFIGNAAGTSAILSIQGSGSELHAINYFGVAEAAVFTLANDGFDFGIPGGHSRAEVLIEKGGFLNTGSTTVSGGPGGLSPTGAETTEARVFIEDPGSAWHARAMTIANRSNAVGEVNVRQGGQLVVEEGLVIGNYPDTRGALNVAGASAQVGGYFVLGLAADGIGKLSVSNGTVGSGGGPTGWWLFGLNGESQIRIGTGGQLLQDSAEVTWVAVTPGSSTRVVVGGNGAIWDGGAILALGVHPFSFAAGGECDVTVTPRAEIRASQILVGPNCRVRGAGTIRGSVVNFGGSISKSIKIFPDA